MSNEDKLTLNLADILNVHDTQEKDVDMRKYGWGGFVKIRSMTGEGRDAYELSLYSEKDGKFSISRENMKAKLIAACAIDDKGVRMFKNSQQIKILGDKSAAAINHLYEECRQLNAISDKDVEELTGN